MKQIAVICAILAIILIAVTGCLAIFGVISFDLSRSIVLKVGAAIALLGVCTALIVLLVRATGGAKD